MRYFKDHLKIKPNKAGKTPLMLYNENNYVLSFTNKNLHIILLVPILCDMINHQKHLY